jgi:hypothetical protein
MLLGEFLRGRSLVSSSQHDSTGGAGRLAVATQLHAVWHDNKTVEQEIPISAEELDQALFQAFLESLDPTLRVPMESQEPPAEDAD